MDIERPNGVPRRFGGGDPTAGAPRPPGPRPRGCAAEHRHHPAGWEPLSGPDLLDRLRVTGQPRPRARPELVHLLRSGLESGLGAGGEGGIGGRPGFPPGVHHPAPLVVTKDRLTRVLACEPHSAATPFGQRTPSVALACGAIVDALFRQLVTVGSVGDPMADGLAALAVDDRQSDLVGWVERLSGTERDELGAEVERQAEGLRRRWPALDPSWLPRTQEAMRVRLADGALELSARVDLAIGRPAGDVASVAIVEVKSGARRAEHRADLHFSALLETLRSPAPPFAVATYYTRTGELDVDPVTDELLMGAARRTLTGARRLADLADGAEPGSPAHPQCRRCSLLPEGGVGDGDGEGR
jgi:hypothetical protein